MMFVMMSNTESEIIIIVKVKVIILSNIQENTTLYFSTFTRNEISLEDD